jgi:hypothetical protein
MRLLLAIMLLLLTACSSGGGHSAPPPPPQTQSAWSIGPIIRGQNYSVGMPASPTPIGAGWLIQFPMGANTHVDYVQWHRVPSLVGVKQVVMRYEVTGSGFVAHGATTPATVGLCFQRRGDDWSGVGAMQSYRWYSRQLPELKAGSYVLTVPLDLQNLGDVYGKSDNAAALAATLADLDNLAVVFGNTSGAGHGVYTTAPATFKMAPLEFIQ